MGGRRAADEVKAHRKQQLYKVVRQLQTKQREVQRLKENAATSGGAWPSCTTPQARPREHVRATKQRLAFPHDDRARNAAIAIK